jgi:hypothetical protein
MVAVFALSGCAHKSLFQEKTDEFVGHPLSAVAAKLGAPTEESVTCSYLKINQRKSNASRWLQDRGW